MEANGDTVYAAVIWSEGIEWEIETAPTTATGDANITVDYIDQDGNAETTAAFAVGNGTAVGDSGSITLNAGDSGVRDVTDVTLTGGWTGAATGNVTIMGATTGNVLGAVDKDGAFVDGDDVDAPMYQYPLYKSIDTGATWSGLEDTTSFPSGVTVKAIATAPDDPDVVAIVTSADEVEYSSNGGSSWTDLDAPSDTSPVVAAGTLSAIDISPGTTRYVAVGGQNGAGNAELFTIQLAMAQSWQARYTSAAGIKAQQTDIKAVEYSPNYATDKAIAVVSGNTSDAVFQIFRYEQGDYDWNGQIDYLEAADWATGITLDTITGGLAAADIAFPETYLANDEGERLVYTAVAGAATGGGIVRLTDTVDKGFQTWSGGDEGGIGSLAYHESGKIVAGSYDDNKVYQYLSPTAVTPKATRVNSLKQPSGVDKTLVVYSGDTVLAATSGDESAMAVSTDDGYSFNDVGLIDTAVSVIDDFAVNADGSKVYLTTHDTVEQTGNYDASVWKKEDTWTRVFSSIDLAADANAAFLVRVAPEDDAAVYLASKSTDDIWVSKNSGEETWKPVPCYKVTWVQDMAVESADVAYVLDTATGQGVSKTTNAGASWGATKEPIKSIDGYMISLAPNGDILVGDTAGYVAFSKDGGSTFERTKDFGTGNAIVVADDDYADNNIIYVGVGTSVKRGKADVDYVPATRGTTTLPVTGMAQVGEVTYVLTAQAGSDSVLYMSLLLETAASEAKAEWTTTDAAAETYLSEPQALKLSDSSGSPKLWAIDTTTPALESYTDATSMAAPTLVSPADEATVGVNTGSGRAYDITFIFERYSDSDIEDARIEVATDSDFNAIVYSDDYANISTDTIAKVVGPYGNDGTAEFLPGETYYWRVRTTTPLNSPWSETRSFIVESLEAPFNVSGPVAGASQVSTTPVLTWSAYPDAIRYELALSEDPSFQILEWSHNVDNTFYAITEALEYSTTYYWRVRGVTGESYTVGRTVVTPAGPWVTGVFTTEAEAVEEQPQVITITEPAPPAEVVIKEVPTTTVVQQPIPSWMLLTIIIIGAILVIALIVLIVRTRRVA
jgi:hypothetical protein